MGHYRPGHTTHFMGHCRPGHTTYLMGHCRPGLLYYIFILVSYNIYLNSLLQKYWDSNPGAIFINIGFQNQPFKPLRHISLPLLFSLGRYWIRLLWQKNKLLVDMPSKSSYTLISFSSLLLD